MLKWKHPQKPKRATKSNKRATKGICLFWFLSQKQDRATKGNKRQMETRTKNQNKKQRAFFLPISIYSHQFRTNGRWLISRAMKSNDEQRKAAESYEEQQKATMDIGAGKTKTGQKKNQDEQRKAQNVQMETRLNTP